MDDELRKMEEEIRSRNESLMERDPIYALSDRKRLINSYMEFIHASQHIPQPGRIVYSMCHAPNASLPTIPLEKTNMIDIEEILRSGMDFVHEGKFILCRSIMPSVKMPSQEMLIDDPAGLRCLRVSLYNYEGTIRPGSILAIMHPWFKSSTDKLAIIRVENPMHVQVFDGDEPLLQEIDWKEPMPIESGVTEMKRGGDIDWAEEGKWHFADKNYGKAIHYFSKAIQMQPENPIFYSNRALAYLKIENPQLALVDTETGLKIEPTNIKMLFRKGKALAMLNRYEEAVDFLENAKKRIKELSEKSAMKDKATSDENVLAQLINEVKKMRREHEKGEYDIMNIREEAKKSKILENHADFVAADKFEVKEIAGKGRGLVAKETIPQGTLLMATKAFVFAEFAQLDTTTYIDSSSNPVEFPAFDVLVKKACKKISANPALGEDFYKLYAGENYDVLEKIDESNPLDIDRISNIVRWNAFGSNTYCASAPTDKGIWIMPSYLNHSCVDSNCFRFVYGDFAFVRSTKTINPGEELMIQYVPGACLYEKRKESLRRQFDFECTCRLCKADAGESDKIRKRHDEIYAIYEKMRSKYEEVETVGEQADISLLENLLKESIGYRPDLSINFEAMRMQESLFWANLLGNPNVAVKILEKIFENCLQANDLKHAFMYAQKFPSISESRSEKGKWISECRRLAKILFGDQRMAFSVIFMWDWDFEQPGGDR